jgi:hypothetical protein
MLSVIMLSVVMLSVVMLSVVMLSVLMLNVVEPDNTMMKELTYLQMQVNSSKFQTTLK